MSTSMDQPSDFMAFWADNSRAEHPVLAQLRLRTANSSEWPEPISHELANFITFLIGLIDARLAIQIGVSSGYNALLIGLAVRSAAGPGARLFTHGGTEEEAHAAQAICEDAHLQGIIELRGGRPVESLDALANEGYQGRIDFVSIDGKQADLSQLYEKGLSILRTGGVMVVTNLIASRDLGQNVAADQRVYAHVMSVGGGLLLVRKL
jgi:O-methyltransferase